MTGRPKFLLPRLAVARLCVAPVTRLYAKSTLWPKNRRQLDRDRVLYDTVGEVRNACVFVYRRLLLASRRLLPWQMGTRAESDSVCTSSTTAKQTQLQSRTQRRQPRYITAGDVKLKNCAASVWLWEAPGGKEGGDKLQTSCSDSFAVSGSPQDYTPPRSVPSQETASPLASHSTDRRPHQQLHSPQRLRTDVLNGCANADNPASVSELHPQIASSAKREAWLLFFHGGAFCLGTPSLYKPMLEVLTGLSKLKALAPDYRRSPEHTWPFQIHDCVDAYKHLLDRNKRVVFVGDSAGGNLAVSVTLYCLGQLGLPPPAAILTFSPWLDLTLEGPSYSYNLAAERLLTIESIKRCAWLYLRGSFSFGTYDNEIQERLKKTCEEKGMPYVYSSEEEKYKRRLRNPLVSPVYVSANAQLHDFPQSLFHVGSEEVLLSDSLIFARKVNHFVSSPARHEGNKGGQEQTRIAPGASVPDWPASFEVLGSLSPAFRRALSESTTTSSLYAPHYKHDQSSTTLRGGVPDDLRLSPACNLIGGGSSFDRVTVKVWDKEIHAFPAFLGLESPNAKLCLEESAEWINTVLQNK